MLDGPMRSATAQ